ncbi:MAG TPA: tetratricopeptide repeat protein [Pyrinomonadaceae bacterium]|nr:tetratricopeptide repeat protein [Pyrinomonadaceae bacterium]
MYLRLACLPFLLFSVFFQTQSDLFRRHYEEAGRAHAAGNFKKAEEEFNAILAEAYERLGKVYSAQGNYTASVAPFESAVAIRPAGLEGIVELSIAYFRTRQYQKSIDLLQPAISANPQYAPAHHMLGKSYFMLSQFDKATAELQTTLKLAPNDYDAEYTLGLAYLKQRQVPEAKQLFQHMVDRLGNRPQLRVLLGRAYRETGFLPESIEEFKAALALDPKFPRVHYYLGLTYLYKDGATKIADAMKEFEIELAANPEEYFANFYLGILYIIERKWDPAITLLEKAASKQPNNPDPYFHLGQAYQGAGKHQQAADVLKKSIDLTPSLAHNDYQVTTAHYRLGQSLIKVGRTAEGQKELQTSADLKSKGFKLDEKKVGAFLSGNVPSAAEGADLVKAEGVVNDTVSLDPKIAAKLKEDESYLTKVLAAAHNSIGVLRAEQQDFREASKQFALAAKWNPKHQGLNYNLGLAYYKSESYKEAVPVLENELKANPDLNNVAIKQLLGMSYFMISDFPKAAAMLSEVVAAKPQEVALQYPLALSLLKDGKTEAANRVIEQMVAAGGNSPQLHILFSQAHYERGDVDKALGELRAALALDDKVRLAHFYSGLIYLKAGKFAEAAREFEGELMLNPKDVEAKFHLGFVILAQQQTERGLKLMREVVQERPDFADARYELGKALLQKGDVKGSVESLEIAARLKPNQPHVHYQLGRAYIAAGRKAEGESQLEISRELKEKARTKGNQ